MTGSTKILTVSYGTFSCTLEGFDDPFGTMRGIAEYFRDLAADDRYFGAEPPTPDVEMLQRIAEKEVQRRVEARLGDSGVALTQVTGPSAPAPADEEKVEAAESSTPAPEAAPEADSHEDAGSDTGPLTHDDEFLLSDEPEDVLAVDPDVSLRNEGPAETVAEKLRRIRAVVSRSIEPAPARDDRAASAFPVEDAEQPTRRERALTETIRQISADLSDDEDAPEDRAEASADEHYYDDDVDGDAPVVPDFAASDMHEADDEDDEDDEDETGKDDDVLAHVAEAIGKHPDTPPDADDTDDDGWDFDTDGLTTASREDKDEDARSDEESADDRVARVLSNVLDDRDDDDETEDDEPDDALTPDAPDGPATSPAARRTSRPLNPISDEGEDVGRLLAETDNHLKDDESVRRRRVISQMRAAVAATKADRLVSRRVTTRDNDEADDQARYRNDLSAAVREVSRPVPDKGSDRKPSVAPLVLVSSQRVDPSSQADEDGGDDTPQDFAGFAKSMGARELTDLLEAAGAYSAFVEGQPSFSRPEIMKRVARVDPTLKLSREDGLRSFGQLLRQGKFRKLERGQFTIAETTRFKPEQRFVGE